MGANENRWDWIWTGFFIVMVWVIMAVALFY